MAADLLYKSVLGLCLIISRAARYLPKWALKANSHHVRLMHVGVAEVCVAAKLEKVLNVCTLPVHVKCMSCELALNNIPLFLYTTIV